MRNNLRITFAATTVIAVISIVALAVLSITAQQRSAASPPPYRAPRLADGHPDLNGIWQAFVTANIAFLQTHRAHAAALVRIQQDTTELARSDQAQLADVLRRGQASGVLRTFDPQLMAVFVLSIRDGIIRQLELDPELDLDAAAREFAALVEQATRKA